MRPLMRTAALAPFLALLVWASSAEAQLQIPPNEAEADSEAHYQDTVVPSALVTHSLFAAQNALAIPIGIPQGNFATSSASATTIDLAAANDRRVRGSSELQGFVFTMTPVDATVGASSHAQSTSLFVVEYVGPDPIPMQADVSLRLTLSGTLEIGGPISASFDDMEAGFDYTATAISPSSTCSRACLGAPICARGSAGRQSLS